MKRPGGKDFGYIAWKAKMYRYYEWKRHLIKKDKHRKYNNLCKAIGRGYELIATRKWQ